MIGAVYDPVAEAERELARLEAQYEYTLNNGRCRDCEECDVCDWDKAVGWCRIGDEFVRPDDAPAEYGCEEYRGPLA